MSAVFDERDEYLKSPYFTKHEYGDFAPFYITITICTILGISLFILNIVLGCCSRHSTYWNDRHTGNRWLVSLWSATPHLQPSLDYTELQDVATIAQQNKLQQQQVTYEAEIEPNLQVEYVELQKRESDI